MTHSPLRRSRLMTGCASAALALALMLAPEHAAAQGVQATPNVTLGDAVAVSTASNETTVTVRTPVASINWTPQLDGSGNALDFLPTGNRLIFQDSPGQGGFAVLNRLLPSPNGNIAVINGTVISRLQAAGAPITTPGGFVAFYSPTGILVGANANFDVGSLMLTTLDPDLQSFQNFATSGGTMFLSATPGSTARIQISNGAQFTATRENSFFAVVAADVEMLGSARINGSHAYVAGEVVSLSFSNGLFNITVPTGTAASGEVVTLNGTVGGPSSTGLNGDSHMVYAVARGAADPISMLFSGNLGFDPAASAGIVNGEIILAAGYNVFGRNVAGSAISEGLDATFGSRRNAAGSTGDITLLNVQSGSSLLAIGNGQTIAAGESRIRGNLMLVGRSVARVNSNSVDNFTIDGDLLVDARDYGVTSSSLQQATDINATGGQASVLSRAGSTLRVGGNVLVTADAFGGANTLTRQAGRALGGFAELDTGSGRIFITGRTSLSAAAFGSTLTNIITGADSRGGLARFSVRTGGAATVGGDLTLVADATGASGSLTNASTVSNAFGGGAQVLLDGTATLGVTGALKLSANATARGVNAATGALADAGDASITVDGAGTLNVADLVDLSASAFGGNNAGGAGGAAFGGTARAVTRNGGTILVGADFSAQADADGGDGVVGGDGTAGIAGANAITGTIAITGSGFASAAGGGGSASFGFGGIGGTGRGGNAFFQADGIANGPALLTIGGNADVNADGSGGQGGASDGLTISAGRGGDGIGGQFTQPNQADPAFNSGAFLLAGGDYGQIAVSGTSRAAARGIGGRGGEGATVGSVTFAPGRGGDGFGGLAQGGLALLGGPGTVRGGVATFGDLTLDAAGFGGEGGIDPQTDVIGGNGGDGSGGSAFLTVRAGRVQLGSGSLVAGGSGGEGILGGNGLGGTAAVFGGFGGRLFGSGLNVSTLSSGGRSDSGLTGDGTGGTSAIEGDGISIDIDRNVVVDAGGIANSTNTGARGNGNGGTAYIGFVSDSIGGSIAVGGHTLVIADGRGGGSVNGAPSGVGRGGLAYVEARGGGTITLNSVQVTAQAQGGAMTTGFGGRAQGGTAELRSTGGGSVLTILNNVPDDFQSLFDGAILNADGLGGPIFDSGIGGVGSGGTIGVRATGGGSIVLPVDPAVVRGGGVPLLMVARGFGRNSTVEGSSGGGASGGLAIIEADGAGSSIVMGETLVSLFADAGGSGDATRNIGGGNAFGGRAAINALNGGVVSLASVTMDIGAAGGNGSGTGNGGDALLGSPTIRLNNGGTLAITGVLRILNEATGGDGVIGGRGFFNNEGGMALVEADNSAITLQPGANGNPGGIEIAVTATGGTGRDTGGSARALPVSFRLTNTNFINGRLAIVSSANGGRATGANGVGGLAVGSTVTFNIVNSALELVGPTAITSSATGGASSGADGTGGDATSGVINASLLNSTLTSSGIGSGAPGILRVVSRATGGAGTAQGGNATTATLALSVRGSSLSTEGLEVRSVARGGNGTGAAGIGGTALSGDVSLFTNPSDINFLDSALFESAAQGGDGVTGGDAFAGDVTAELNSTDVSGSGELRIASTAVAGTGITVAGVSGVGNAASGDVALWLRNSLIETGTLTLQSNASAESGNIAVAGGSATAGSTLLRLSGSAVVDVFDLLLESSAFSSFGQTQGVVGTDPLGNPIIGTIFDFSGETYGGFNRLLVDQGGTGGIGAGNQIRLVSDINGGGLNVAGRFSIEVLSGEVNAPILSAVATGFVLGDDSLSQVIVRNARLLAQSAEFITAGDLDFVTSGGGIIGSDAAPGATNSVFASAGGSITVRNQIGGAPLPPDLGGGSILPQSSPTSGGGIGGFGIELSAGRSIIIDSILGSPNGAIRLVANGAFAPSVAQPTPTVITMTPAARIDAGTGLVTFELRDGFGNPQQLNGAITLGNISAGRISARNFGTLAGTDVIVLTGSVLRASGTGRAIDLASLGGEVVNRSGDAGLVLTGGGHFAIYGATPTGSQIGNPANYARRYDVQTAAAYDALNPGGNFAAFRITPVLTVTANNVSRVYGNPNPVFTASFSGFLPGDSVADITGLAQFITQASQTSNVGTFSLGVAQGTLVSVQGYRFVFGPPATLTITPRPITVTASNLSRVYGDANPLLTFTVGGLGLVNGDQLSGALATTAGATTGVGNVAITQGNLAATANYILTFNPGILSITPRPLIVAANNLTRVYGNANPALTFTTTGQTAAGSRGLVNGDQLTGALTTTAGATTGVGTVAITQGTLTAGPNYALTVLPGILTITPRPLTITADNLSKLLGRPDPVLTYTVTGDGLVNGDQIAGALAREPGERIASFAITQGTLSAGPNYTTTFVGGTFTIERPPAPEGINNPEVFEKPVSFNETPPAVEDEDEKRYGVDFPERPEAPLISEDPLLDDPVASGGDASVYGGTATPPPSAPNGGGQ
jgi:hypothetical protein